MNFKLLRLSIPFVWFGAVCAISFMEAPLKFQAPGITVELGLGIGRLVFQVLNKIEVALALLLLASLICSKPKFNLLSSLFAIVLAILFIQTVWLLPALDARAAALLNGDPQSPSHLHIIYIFADSVKVILLFAVGMLGLGGVLKENAD